MNENYLLHNETAKRLYFEYARDLPIISLCSDVEVDDKIYNNVTEAFLTNDCYKLDAMRAYGVDEKYVTGDASDYEKFKVFCYVLPKFAGNPIYLLSHVELRKNYNCSLQICEDTCDEIWEFCNSKIIADSFSDQIAMKRSDVSFVKAFYPFIFNEINDLFVNSLSDLESRLTDMISSQDSNGCKAAVCCVIDKFIKPNPYQANQILLKLKEGTSIAPDEMRLLDIQIYRTLGSELKKRNWSLIWCKEDYGAEPYIDDEALDYLNRSNALPKSFDLVYIDIEEGEKEISSRLEGFARKNILGKFIFLPDIISPTSAFARVDYTRRIICNIIGKWVEDGEYASDEKTLKRLIQDILYNNLKEAIS
ncbi:MAG: glucuronate isomerase [Clostridia bacterium]|nr:glucuronate isomerase [Clostridia bacterium]